ncbi:MAG: putative outer membrane protein [Dactylosporangium sp.]|jgi:putative membrane protein|nr:putative outer membrane protein [Dactylosporangium sp.]
MRVPIVAGLVAVVCAALAAPTVAPIGAVAAPVTAAPSPAPSGQLSARDRAFLTAAGHGAQFEVTSGKLAVDRAADPRIRAFGDRMVRDHGKEYQQLQDLDRSLGLTPPAGPGTEQQKVIAIWSSLRGGPFDCSYAPLIFADHQVDLHLYMAMAGHATDARVRAFAKAQVPVLRQHLQLADKNLTGLNCSAPPKAPSVTST